MFAKPTACFTRFPPGILWLKLGFLGVSIFLYMVQLYGFILPRITVDGDFVQQYPLKDLVSSTYVPHMHNSSCCLFNIVIQRSSKLLSSAIQSQSNLIGDIFSQSSTLVYFSRDFMQSMVPVTGKATQNKTAYVQISSVTSDLALN